MPGNHVRPQLEHHRARQKRDGKGRSSSVDAVLDAIRRSFPASMLQLAGSQCTIWRLGWTKRAGTKESTRSKDRRNWWPTYGRCETSAAATFALLADELIPLAVGRSFMLQSDASCRIKKKQELVRTAEHGTTRCPSARGVKPERRMTNGPPADVPRSISRTSLPTKPTDRKRTTKSNDEEETNSAVQTVTDQSQCVSGTE